jgi:predicted DNA-binding transcriptional regulator YafY
MQGDQLAMQWRILRILESKKHGATVAELAAQGDRSPRTVWRDLAAIEPAILTLLFQSDRVLLVSIKKE